MQNRNKINIGDVIKEVIEPNSVDTASIQFHEKLSPLIWDGDVIKSDVRKALLLNAKRFIEFSGVENLKFNDITLTGSMANYNYNDNSDLDVHIVIDYSQISENKEFVADFFKLKKQLWSELLPIQVKGHDVELYFQNKSEKHHSSGVYSLMNNKWINKPTKKIINIDTPNIKLKAADFMNSIDDLESNKNKKNWLDKYEQLKEKIKKYRQTGLDTGGEFSVENLVFKVLRNTGYLEKMVDLKNNYLQNELSLDELEI
jgi:cell fate (sporulation/competence/biofilm development) regulator YlbF (YheA/YmcA/DUF963 family)